MRLAFGDCIVDLAARQLTRAGTVLPLEPKMFELLEVLIERRPAVVRSEELDEILWPRVYVERSSLTRLVSELRSVLGDTARDSKIIRTAYKQGYAFDAAVTTVADAAGSTPAVFALLWNDKLLPLGEGAHVAGRDDDCDLVIDAVTVSRRHARFSVSCDSVSVEDLGSTNGTSVNGTLIRAPTPLMDGNQVSLGTARLWIKKRKLPTDTVKVSDTGDADPYSGG